jgi:hypothetical protein
VCAKYAGAQITRVNTVYIVHLLNKYIKKKINIDADDSYLQIEVEESYQGDEEHEGCTS